MTKTSEVVQKRYCMHASEKVTISSRFAYPADIMPEMTPRITNRNCSHFFDCNLQDKSACVHAVKNLNADLQVETL